MANREANKLECEGLSCLDATLMTNAWVSRCLGRNGLVVSNARAYDESSQYSHQETLQRMKRAALGGNGADLCGCNKSKYNETISPGYAHAVGSSLTVAELLAPRKERNQMKAI